MHLLRKNFFCKMVFGFRV